MIKEEVKMKNKYAVITSKETCEIRNEEVFPENLGRQDLLVSAHYSMISAGTELAGFSALSPGVYQKGAWNAYPWRSGYGLVGKAEKIGEEVHHIKEGERVFCFGNHAQRQIWPLVKFMENSTYSAFPVHNDLDDQTLTASRMALVAITGPQVSGVELGDTVAVFGLGMVGNIAAQYYQHLGARVIAFDTSAMRCQKARQVGLEEVFDISPEKQVKVVQDLTNGRGANITVDAVGSSSVVLNCVNATARYGKVVLLGTPRAEVAGNLTELLRPVHMRCLQILGAFEWRVPAYDQVGVPHSIESNLKMIWDLIQRGKLNVLDLITHVVKPEEMQLAYMGLLNDKERYLGVLVDWQE
jgi:2-desacetyl-2-hydroxyethyl bacteriochlorophyllide A dehydrogenase